MTFPSNESKSPSVSQKHFDLSSNVLPTTATSSAPVKTSPVPVKAPAFLTSSSPAFTSSGRAPPPSFEIESQFAVGESNRTVLSLVENTQSFPDSSD